MQDGMLPLGSLRIYHDKNMGMRKYMEDEITVISGTYDQIPTTYLGVFDGHGGREAAIYARDHLFDNLKTQPGFFDTNPEKVKEAIREGFLKTHWDMFKIVETWPKRKDGHNSTSGTTATVVILRANKIYVAHVGDSAAVLAQKKNNQYVAEELTEDHKPESVKEKSRIENLGGHVASTKGVPRVIWKRAVKQALNITPRYEYVPFLAVSRALGDFWSYDTHTEQFIVSPDPDVHHIDLDGSSKNKFIILASDGLWGVMNAKETVEHVCKYELSHSKRRRNCSKSLVDESLSIWQRKRARADNISVIVVFLDDEFKTWSEDDDNESVASSEADTVIMTNGEDDTPPMSSSENLSSLVRQIALPFSPSVRATSPDVLGSSSRDENRNNDVTDTREEEKFQKRKLRDGDSELASKAKKARIEIGAPLSIVEDSHQCNMITVLSAESLVDLQLDEDLGFVDEESDCSNKSSNNKRTRCLEKPIKFSPVPQAAK